MLLRGRVDAVSSLVQIWRCRLAIFIAGGVCSATISCVLPSAQAGNKTWSNNGTDFNTGGNWAGGVPGTNDVAVFNVAMSKQPNLSASLTIQELNFSTTASSGYDLTSSNTSIKLTLTRTGTGTTSAINAANTSGTNTIDAPIVLGAAGGGTQTFTQANGGTLVINGVISSTNTVTLSLAGAGTIRLTGTNTYAGATTVLGGIVNIQNGSALGTTAAGTTVASGATLQIQGGISIGAEALTISGTGTAGQNGALVNVSGTNNYGGLLTLGGASTISSDSGTLNLTNTGTITGSGFGLTLTGSGNGSISSIIGTGAGTLTKTGTGTWTLTGLNTFTGATLINAGVLNIQSSTALGTTASGTTVASGAALQILNGILVGAETLTLNGSGISNDGALRNISGTNSWSGPVTLGSASTIASDAGALTLSGTINNGGFLLTTTGVGSIIFSGIISGSGGLTQNGAGTTVLSGQNTFSGSTTINAGTLEAADSSGSALGSTSSVTINSGGTLLLGAFDQINNSAMMTLAGGTFAKGNYSEGAAGLIGMGALVLTASGSHLDFGTGTVGVLSFASFTPSIYTLTIDNWTGIAGTIGDASTDRLIFASDQSSNLSAFNFTSFSGAQEISLGGGFYEIVPMAAAPEPANYLAGVVALVVLGYHERRLLRLVFNKNAGKNRPLISPHSEKA